MQEVYLQHFPCVESIATCCSIFSEKTFAGMSERTPKRFRFIINAPGTATHLPTDTRTRVYADVKYFRANMELLVEEKKLSAVLMQFPNSFRPNERTEEYLRKLRDA